jgi:hypothetical protein
LLDATAHRAGERSSLRPFFKEPSPFQGAFAIEFDHQSGCALDIGATGCKGIRIGRAANCHHLRYLV